MNPTQIVAEALVVVSILDGSMKHASVRRCLRAALSAMDEAQAKGTPLLDGTSRTELASETAERIQTWSRTQASVSISMRAPSCSGC